MVICSAFGCSNRSDRENNKKKGVGFHSFPLDQTLRNLWIQAVQRDNWTPRQHSRVCTEHFSDDVVDRTYVSGPRLKEGAVPSVFPAYAEHLKKVKKFKKSPRSRSSDADVLVVNILSTSDACVLIDELEPAEPPIKDVCVQFRKPPRPRGGDAEVPSTSDACILIDEVEPTEHPIKDVCVQVDDGVTKSAVKNLEMGNKGLSWEVKQLTNKVNKKSRVIKKIKRSNSRLNSRITNMKGHIES